MNLSCKLKHMIIATAAVLLLGLTAPAFAQSTSEDSSNPQPGGYKLKSAHAGSATSSSGSIGNTLLNPLTDAKACNADLGAEATLNGRVPVQLCDPDFLLDK